MKKAFLWATQEMEEPTPPPAELKPWYYQEWFMFPTIVFWPLWAILIIRSPWHNGLVSGAVAWAMLIVGSYLIIWPQLIENGHLNQLTIALIIPGFALTVITQIHWLRYRPLLRSSQLTPQSQEPNSESVPRAARGRRRRRNSRGSRSRRG